MGWAARAGAPWQRTKGWVPLKPGVSRERSVGAMSACVMCSVCRAVMAGALSLMVWGLDDPCGCGL